MNNNVLVVIVAVAVLGTGFALLAKPTPQINVNLPEQSQTYGAVSGPSVEGPYFTIGGVETYYANQSFNATSSTICSIANPFGATSTIRTIGASRTATGIGGTQAFYLSTTTSTGRYGSSTPAFVADYRATTANFAFSWSAGGATSTNQMLGLLQPSDAVGQSTAILGPLEVITLRIATGTPGTFSTYMTGRCTAELQRL